ncbi:MAG TPA: universal stress protein [Thiobacillaceae bacterium]|nr:universal stress protein [Thiobacillaceae bacterium]
MKEIKRILFATDGSEYSLGAQRVAIELAQRCRAEFHAMSIMLSTQDLEFVGTHQMRESREAEIQARLDTVAEAAKAAGLACTTHLVYGEQPEHEIVNTARGIEADLVVLGRRGRRGLARFMVGHATAYVAGHAPCSVLVVPRTARVWQQRILLATDGSPASEEATRLATDVARQCHMPVTVLSATTASHSAQRKQEARLSVDQAVTALVAAGVNSDGLVPEGRPDEVVIEAARNTGADLIVVGSHGRTGLSRLFLGSISERIIGQAQCPVLVARGGV